MPRCISLFPFFVLNRFANSAFSYLIAIEDKTTLVVEYNLPRVIKFASLPFQMDPNSYKNYNSQ